MRDPVIQVINEADGDIVYTIRVKGSSFEPQVFEDGTYALSEGEQGTDRMKIFKGLRPSLKPTAETLKVAF
jgi:hypothetical protein